MNIMTDKQLKEYIAVHYPQENESCEWKEYKNLKHNITGHEGDDLVSYVSAMANMEGGHIVIGVKDKTLDIVGIEEFGSYTKDRVLLTLKEECTNLRIADTTIDEFATSDTHKTVWVVNVPKHATRQPVYAHKRAWQRIGEHLVELSASRLNQILQETASLYDWSGEIVAEATLEDLDESALAKARIEYKKIHPRLADEVDGWDTTTFLNKSKVAIKGKLTRAAILLLGKEDASYLLNPGVAQITWILKDTDGTKIDYEHFGIPFITNVDRVLAKIRNITFREMPDGTLFPEAVKQYDEYVIREVLHNAIAHQDYDLHERICLIENPDCLIFDNGGSFLPGTILNALHQNGPQRYYRNRCLCDGMVNFNMIDTIGRGIEMVFNKQRQRFFPLPDYQITENSVSVKVYGKVLDENYAKLLLSIPDLSLNDCLILDAVQKKKTIEKEEAVYLKKKKYVEGRYPNLFISEQTAKHTGKLPEYVKQKGLRRKQYKDYVIDLMQKNNGKATRKQINDLLLDFVPKSSPNPSGYIGSLLNEMKTKDKIIYFDKNEWKINGK